MSVNMPLHVDRPTVIERFAPVPNELDEVTLFPGAEVEYSGHLPGGNVQVKFEGMLWMMNPHACRELRK